MFSKNARINFSKNFCENFFSILLNITFLLCKGSSKNEDYDEVYESKNGCENFFKKTKHKICGKSVCQILLPKHIC